jgi:hypothetical protein
MADANPFLQAGETYAAQLDAELASAQAAAKSLAEQAAQAVKNLAETKAKSVLAHGALDATKLATGAIKLPSKTAEYVAIGSVVLLTAVGLYAAGHAFLGWPL